MRKIDGKFSINKAGEIVNTVTGVPIPLDEPLILFRARDRNSLPMLREYKKLCIRDGCNDLHLEGISRVIGQFEKFADEWPELMKQPGITRHLKLETDPARGKD